jgi:hypothetical protein
MQVEQETKQEVTSVGATSDNPVPSGENVAVSTPEQQIAELGKVAKMQHKVLSELTRAHLGSLLNTLAFRPGVSGNEKADIIVKILDGVEGVLDLGLDITKVTVPEKGAIGKQVAMLSGILAQALDNRMLLLAHQMEAKQNSVGANVEANKAAEAVEGN